MDDVYVGQMSGTSLDGIDTALASFSDNGVVRLHATRYDAYPDSVRSSLLELLDDPLPNSELAKEVDARLAELYARAAAKILKNARRESVKAIGCHGQTILHQPQGESPFSWQAGDHVTLAKLTGLPVIGDFRAADIQAGGHGAPLAPAFHAYAFAHSAENRCIVNIGGIANITCLPAEPSKDVIGFDTGPGNSLSDQWIRMHRRLPYDQDGKWALSQNVDEALLARLADDAYFRQLPPKSLDARKFSMSWLAEKLAGTDASAATVQSTLSALTAETIVQGLRLGMEQAQAIFVCGGGAKNDAIIEQLRRRSGLPVAATDALGVPSDHVESVAFAWLARQHLNDAAGNLPSVTGAREAVVLGRKFAPR